ncbi:MAG TPA: biotin--[acetyl-CoA-carboxylase] ligase [Rhizomicrobium sp.]|nr:biotin--[acetyl-CoA-carboxylase] ligase [Rhizomicrobium sp.]
MIEGYGLKEFEALDSTNEEARRLAEAGERGPLWLLAARQSAGRGRQGRTWYGDHGNLFATLLIEPKRFKAEWAQLSFVAAIAVAETVAPFAPGAALKWPNDVLIAGQKIAGILLETAGQGLAIGIGVNLAHYPDGTELPATSLAELGAKPPSPREALDLLACHFAQWYDTWDKAGFAPVKEAWLARATGLGSRIRARLPGREYAGVFEGLDDQGALLLNDGGSIRALAAADIYFE